MPIHWTEHEDGAYVEIKASGTVLEKEWFELHHALLGNVDKASRMKHVLSDWTAASDVRLSGEAIRLGAHLSVTAKFSGRIAIVASEEVVYGLARMWEAHVERAPWPHGLFKDIETAKAWLHSDQNN